MGAEKRSLKRVSNKYGQELSARIFCGDRTVASKVIDFNAVGVAIAPSNDSSILDEHSKIDKIELLYGRESICTVENPSILRSQHSKHLIISFRSSQDREHLSRADRVSLTLPFQGILSGIDPLTVDHLLYFKVTQVSEDGFRMVSSKSNHHLVPGMRFSDFRMVIPGQKEQKISFIIKNVSDQQDHIQFGCQILEKEDSFNSIFKKIRIVSSNLEDLSAEQISEIKMDIRKVKKFIGQIRITTVKTENEYQQVLKLRYKAYRAAQKVSDNQTPADMADGHDEHAIIMTAYVGVNLVGTMRIVMAEPGKNLPLERQFDLSQIPKIDPARSAEVSRFAIDPLFQGTDLFIAISRKLVIELTAKRIAYPLCLSTKKLADSYKALGAVQMAKPVSHPTIPGETLTLYWLVPEKVYAAKTGSLSWVFVISPSLKLLKKYGLITKTSSGIQHYFLMLLEILKMKFKKQSRRK